MSHGLYDLKILFLRAGIALIVHANLYIKEVWLVTLFAQDMYSDRRIDASR